MENLPSFLTQGETARLFPVLATTSKEGRTTSIVLACLSKVEEFGRDLLASAGQKVGARARIETYTEIVTAKKVSQKTERPDGLIVLRVGAREWRAFVEAKVGSVELDPDQIERYRLLARENGVDCVITISNQFSTTPLVHPLEPVRKSKSKIPVIHWSWMHILTTADLLISRSEVADSDQMILLNELRRFLTHESAGVRGFDRMPRSWTELNRLVASGGSISPKADDAVETIAAWHQEARDLSLILSRMTGTGVTQRLSRKHLADPSLRDKDELALLRDERQLRMALAIPDAAAPVEVTADLTRRAIDVGMSLRAPEDRKSSKARINWLLRQIRSDDVKDLHLRIFWPGSSPTTQHTVEELRADPDIASVGKEHLAATGFHLFLSVNTAGRFAQQSNFIADLEEIVPRFYRNFGSKLSAWVRSAPQIKSDRSEPGDVTTEALAEDSDSFSADG